MTLLVPALLHSITHKFVVVRPLLTGVCILSIITDESTVWQIEDRAEMPQMSNRTSTTLLVVTEVHINDYNAIRTSFSSGTGIRDNLRENLAEHADADRIFEHAEQLETPATTRKWAKEASEAMEVEEVRAWYSGQE